MELFLLALKIVGILLGILLILFAVLLWCCCVVSGWNSRQDDRDEEMCKRNNQMTVLSDLEQQTFEKLKSELVEDFKYLS